MPLRLDLLRHGDAMPPGPGGDTQRPLSEAGRAAIRRLAETYASSGWRPDRVCSSPLLRARETALIVSSALSPAPTPEVLRELSPEAAPEAVLEALDGGAGDGYLLLVGHQPLLGRLAGLLTGSFDGSLRPGGLLVLSCPHGLVPGRAHLEMQIGPENP